MENVVFKYKGPPPSEKNVKEMAKYFRRVHQAREKNLNYEQKGKKLLKILVNGFDA